MGVFRPYYLHDSDSLPLILYFTAYLIFISLKIRICAKNGTPEKCLKVVYLSYIKCYYSKIQRVIALGFCRIYCMQLQVHNIANCSKQFSTNAVANRFGNQCGWVSASGLRTQLKIRFATLFVQLPTQFGTPFIHKDNSQQAWELSSESSYELVGNLLLSKLLFSSFIT